MNTDNSPLQDLRSRLASGEASTETIAAEALARANSNAGANVYISAWHSKTMAEARALEDCFPDKERRPLLYGVPVSVKDCFDVRGFQTTCGTRFYGQLNGIAERDSAVVARLRQMGATIIGKTNLHPLAYGITGENREFGDCVQPAHATRLTGGSSSGAAASVQEGSALAAIGTDTGGSIRVPAALCGLAGYRASIGLGDWAGGAHLAQSFDTLGWLFKDLRDGPALAEALFGIRIETRDDFGRVKIGVAGEAFLQDCEAGPLSAFEGWKESLRAAGAEFATMQTDYWAKAMEIFAPVQAHEAAGLHKGHFVEFEASIRERLEWGASLGEDAVKSLRVRHAEFRAQMDTELEQFDFLMVPCSPMEALAAGADHSETRKRILRYTVAASLAGTPVVVLPGKGGGVQLIGRRGSDGFLLGYAAWAGNRILN